MGTFVDGKKQHENVQNTHQVVNTNIDLALLSALLSNTVSDAVSKQIGKIKVSSGTGSPLVDEFDDTKTQEKIAQSMLIERINKEANFDNLGNIKTTKKDQKSVDDTINMLSDLDD